MIFTNAAITRFYVRKAAVLAVSVLASVLLLTIGCTGPATDPYAPRIVGRRIVFERPAAIIEVLGRSVGGRPIECYRFGDDGPAVLFIATIHGNEWAGTPLLRRLIDYLHIQPSLWEDKTVAVVPLANPDGYILNIRGNAHGIDLNRNFSAANRVNNSVFGQSALSEPEAQILAQLIDRLQPVLVVSLHQPLDCLDYDGPGKAQAEQMAMVCPLRVKKLGPQPGSMGSYVGQELGIPIITMELRGEDSYLDAQQLWQLYGQALLTAINFQL